MTMRKKRKKDMLKLPSQRAERQYALLEGTSLGLFGDDSYKVGFSTVGVGTRLGISYLYAASHTWMFHNLAVEEWLSKEAELPPEEKAEHVVIALGYIRQMTRKAYDALARHDADEIHDYWFRPSLQLAKRVDATVIKCFGGISVAARQATFVSLRENYSDCERNLNQTLMRAWELHQDIGVQFVYRDCYFDEQLKSVMDARLTEYFDLGLSHFYLEQLPSTARHWGDAREL